MSWELGKLTSYMSLFERTITPPDNIDQNGFIKDFSSAEEILLEALRSGLFNELDLTTEHIKELAFVSNVFSEAMLTDIYQTIEGLPDISPSILSELQKYSNMMFFQGFIFALFLNKQNLLT